MTKQQQKNSQWNGYIYGVRLKLLTREIENAKILKCEHLIVIPFCYCKQIRLNMSGGGAGYNVMLPHLLILLWLFIMY